MGSGEGQAGVRGWISQPLVSCPPAAQCEMSEWGPWGPCSKKRKVCGFKKGNQDRTRKILQAPAGDVSVCPATTEVRRCTVQKSQCPEGKLLPQHFAVSAGAPFYLGLVLPSCPPAGACFLLHLPGWVPEPTCARRGPLPADFQLCLCSPAQTTHMQGQNAAPGGNLEGGLRQLVS